MSVRQKEKYVHRPTPCGIPLTQLSVDYSNTKTKEYANIRIYRSLYDIEKHATRKQNKKKQYRTHTHTRERLATAAKVNTTTIGETSNSSPMHSPTSNKKQREKAPTLDAAHALLSPYFFRLYTVIDAITRKEPSRKMGSRGRLKRNTDAIPPSTIAKAVEKDFTMLSQ
jgi:hypothetical protein